MREKEFTFHASCFIPQDGNYVRTIFNWRGRQRPFTCNDIEARLVMYEDGRLPTQETAAFKAHLWLRAV